MWQVIGQTKAVNSLKRSFAEGRLSHAYLLVGPQHVGKMTLAINLSQVLNCLFDDKPCGQCQSCRRIASGNHPDVQVIERAGVGAIRESPPQKEIGIEQIREMQHSVNLKPYEGNCRVIIIDGAEFMSEEAANALLKTLEEPPDSTVFILLAGDENSILPTILSRCQRLELPPVPVQTVRQALVEQWKVMPERADLLARLSYGCIGWAISAIDNENMLEEHSRHLESLIALANSDISERFEFASQLAAQFNKNRASVREWLELWLTWWRDLLLMKNGCAEFITNIDREGALQQQAARYSLSAIYGMTKSVQETMRQLDQNANPRLALEVLMLNEF